MSRSPARALLAVGALYLLAGVGVGEDQTEAKAIRIQQEIIDSRLPQPASETTVTWLGRGSLRVDTELDSSSTPMVSTIFRRDSQGYLILDHDTKEALIYDREQVRLIAARREEAQQRLMERVDDDPTGTAAAIVRLQEQRKVTAGRSLAKDQVDVLFEKTSETGELEGTPWIKYREVRNGLVTQEFLVTPWDQLSVGAGVVEVLEDLGRFVKEAQEISIGAVRVPNPYESSMRLGGFPIAGRRFDGDGNIVLETKLISIDTVEDDGSVFGNPGYPERGVAENLPEEESTP